jgi:ATP-dependent RNA helicase DeaD
MAPEIRELATKFLHAPVTVTIQSPKASPRQIQQTAYVVPKGWNKGAGIATHSWSWKIPKPL